MRPIPSILVVLSMTGCLSVAGLDKDFVGDLGAAGSDTGGTSGAAGTSGAGGSAGSGAGGKGGSGQGVGGASTECPPTSFGGLPNCQQANATSPCLSCACNDVSAAACGPKFKECIDDPACSKAIECVLRQCPVSKCEPLAGASLLKAQALTGCFTSICASSCPGVM